MKSTRMPDRFGRSRYCSFCRNPSRSARRISLAALCLAALVLLGWETTVRAAHGVRPAGPAGWERIDRGLIVRVIEDGKVYLGWRLLASDPTDMGFHVYRQVEDERPVRLTDRPLRGSTNFIDPSAPRGRRCRWIVRAVVDGREGEAFRSEPREIGSPDGPCIRLALRGDHTFQKVAIADLDGDGRFEFVIKQPNENIDPYAKYWQPSPGTYKLEAYDDDGRFMWRYDLGWAVERGIWYSPYVVYDLDGDGKAEVAVKTGEGDPRDTDGRVRSGPEYLSILEGVSGKPITRVDWIPREGFGSSGNDYNRASRNQLAVAFLDGRRPSLIVLRGTYDLMKAEAWQLKDGRLELQWRWDNSSLGREWSGQGGHWTHAADIDADGRHELLLGSSVIDEHGKPLWTTGLGHPDHFYVGDIDPERPGLEIYYGIERRQPQGNGMCLVDAATGKILWGHQGPTRHVHSRGMCSDIDARYPGSECYSADTDPQKQFAWARLRTAKGQVISEENLGGFGALTACWDADPQRELILGNRVQDYRGSTHLRLEGQVIAVADILGDWREEIITTAPGWLRIYTTTIPASRRHVCLMQDPIYRMDVVCASMGYHLVPMLSYDLASRAAHTAPP